MFCNPAVDRAEEILSIVCLSLAPSPLPCRGGRNIIGREGDLPFCTSPSLQSSALPTEIRWPYLRIGCIMCQLFTWFLTPGINHITL